MTAYSGPAFAESSAALKREFNEVDSLLEQGRLLEAESVLSSLAHRYPQSADVHLRYAAVLRSLGETGPAILEYERAAALDSNIIEPLIALSEMDLQNLDLQKALRYGRLALSVAPKSIPARIAYLRTLVESDRISEADLELAPLLKLGGKDPQVLMLAYQIKSKRGDFDQALIYLKEAMVQHGDAPELDLELANLLEASGDQKGAREQLHKIIQSDSRAIEARQRLARNLEVFCHDYDGAIALYTEVLKLDPNSPAALTGIERCRGKKNNLALRLKLAWQDFLASLSAKGK